MLEINFLAFSRVAPEILEHVADEIYDLFQERTTSFYRKGDGKVGHCGKFCRRIDYRRDKLGNVGCFHRKLSVEEEKSRESLEGFLTLYF